MDIKPVRNEEDYEAALRAIEDAWGAKPGSSEADRFEILTVLVKNYEDQHHPIAPPDPIDAIRFRLDQLGLDTTGLSKVTGVGGSPST